MQLLKSILVAFLIVSVAAAQADTIAVIGTGNVGSALGPEFAAQGHTIVYGSRNPSSGAVADLVARTGNNASATKPADAVKHANIVVLAVPGLLVGEITKGLGDLSGKIIIDPTNPLVQELLAVKHGADTSNTEIIQAIAPDANVVKAFNTLNWRIMVDPEEAGGPVSIPIAGDSSKAKDYVADLVIGMGLKPIDVGTAENALWLEGMAILLVNNNFMSPRPNFNFYLRETD